MVYSACAQKVAMLRKVGRKLPSSALRRIYVGAVQPKMGYACAVWCGGPIGKLVELQETFCRQARVSLPPSKRRFDYHTLLLFYKNRSEVVPTYLSSFFTPSIIVFWLQTYKNVLPCPKCKQKVHPVRFSPKSDYALE